MVNTINGKSAKNPKNPQNAGTYPDYKEYHKIISSKSPKGQLAARLVVGSDLQSEIEDEAIFTSFEIQNIFEHCQTNISIHERRIYECTYAAFLELKCLIYMGKSLLLEATISRNQTKVEKCIMKYLAIRKIVNQYLYDLNLPRIFWLDWEKFLPTSKKYLLDVLRIDYDYLFSCYQRLEPFYGSDWMEQIPPEIE